jgi:hypothetical protein
MRQRGGSSYTETEPCGRIPQPRDRRGWPRCIYLSIYGISRELEEDDEAEDDDIAQCHSARELALVVTV